jgi:hypothetical protein
MHEKQLPQQSNNSNVFAFKNTVPQNKQLNYVRKNPNEWEFEQVTQPTDYLTMARQGSTGLVTRNVSGSGYASHWKLDESLQTPPSPSNNNDNTQPMNIRQTSQPHVDDRLNIVNSQQELYRDMFEYLVGRHEKERIENEYNFNQSRKKQRRRIAISELVHQAEY